MSERADSSLYYGETGTGKTCQLGEVAKWEFARTGRITRLISADSGWDPIEHLVRTPDNPEGIIEAWAIQYLPNPFPVLVKLSEGYWPKLSPDGKKLVMSAPTRNAEGRIVSDGREVGQYAVEGISTISDMLMQDHIRNLRKIAEDIVGDFAVSVDVESQGRGSTETLKFGKSARAHYGHVQDFVLLDLVPRFATLPVSRVLWTGHEAKGDDDVTGIKNSVLGPATIGKAAVPRTAKKFGDTFHFAKLVTVKVDPSTKVSQVSVDRRAYYEDAPDDVLTRMLWPAKLSLPLSRVEELQRTFPGGFIPLGLTQGMDKFLDFKLAQASGTAGAGPQPA
jgi:hypothetical protein